MSHIQAQHLQELHRLSKAEVHNLTPVINYPYINQQGGLKKYKRASSAAEEPQIPEPALFKGLDAAPPAEPEFAIPTVAECAVHLELLEVFYQLRSSIVNSTELDTTFGVAIQKRTVWKKQYDYTKRTYVPQEHKLNDPTWKARRREKWSYFLTLAVARFRGWMRKLDVALAARKRQEQEREEGGSSKATEKLPETDSLEIPYLPPLGKMSQPMICWQVKPLTLIRYSHGLACVSAEPARLQEMVHQSRAQIRLRLSIPVGTHRKQPMAT